jgi:uncharacterized membrane-anchored protein
MTGTIELLGRDEVSDRSLFLLDVHSLDSIPKEVKVGSKYFVCFLVCDATAIPQETLRLAATVLLQSGAAFVCTWGDGCEKVHDLMDQVAFEFAPDSTDDSVIMTTWHKSGILQNALWAALNVSWPADQYFDDCRSLLAVVAGLPEVSDVIRAAFADVRAFNSEVLSNDQEQ